MFHLSNDPNLTVLIPRIPETAVEMYENKTIPRVCLATTIDGALSALQTLSGNFYVYKVEIERGKHKLYAPSTEQVIDASVNGELWCLDPVQVTLIGQIHAEDLHKGIPVYVDIHGEKCLCHFHLYDWWWITKYVEEE